MINRDAHIVGLAFDGNLQSLGGAYHFDEAVNRCVSLHAAGLIEALRVVYRTERILKEIVVLGPDGHPMQITVPAAPAAAPAAPAAAAAPAAPKPAAPAAARRCPCSPR